MARSRGAVATTILATTIACYAPPASPLAGIRPNEVSSVSIRSSDATVAELTTTEELVEFLSAVGEGEPFKEGKVASDFMIDIKLADGRVVELRMGPDQIGPSVAGSAVVWRWRLRDTRAYSMAREAIERSREGTAQPNKGMKQTKPS